MKLKATTKTVALLKGKRGILARLVNVTKKDGVTYVAARQQNTGLLLKNATPCKIENGILVGDKQGLLEMGGYVNGRRTGAEIELITDAEFKRRAFKAEVNWNRDGKMVTGLAIGKANEKGLLAIRVEYSKKPFFWQMEQDSNAHNKHERGRVNSPGAQKAAEAAKAAKAKAKKATPKKKAAAKKS